MSFSNICFSKIVISIFVKCWILLLLCNSSLTFNLEGKLPLIKEGPEHSLFGLSVKQHYKKLQPENLDDIVLLVGAPTAAAASYHSPGLVNPGGLFSCNINSDHECHRVRLKDAYVSFEVNSSNSWTGVTIESQKPGGNVAICGHRFVIHGGVPGRNIWEAGVGRCFVLDSELQPTLSPSSYEPCVGNVGTGSYSIDGFGYCQAGTSFAFAETTDADIVIGMPGVGHWTGAIFHTELNPPYFPETLFSYEIDDKNNDEKNQNSYSGFSVATILNGSKPLFISGAPRGNDTGQVIIYKIVDNLFRVTEVLKGETLASAFGYSLEAVDVNGDNYEDLLVGAPQYYNGEKKHGGAVYIYINDGKGSFGPTFANSLYGDIDSTFGISITSLGDINKDGFDDIAVGAPGADYGMGKVYIYHGEANGIRNKPSQIITGSNYKRNQNKLFGFGYTVSGGLDMDFNEYPDLAVGTLSDIVFIFRSRPIIDIKGYISTSSDKVNINSTAQYNPNVVTIKDEHTQKTIKVVSFNITACLSYTSKSKLYNFPVEISYKLMLDVEQTSNDVHSRLMFVPFKFEETSKTGILTLPPQSQKKITCITAPVYLENNIQNKLSPFVLSLSYEVVEKNISEAAQIAPMNQFPVSNKDLLNTVFTHVNISKNCGPDDVCTSNLKLNAEYVILLEGKTTWELLKIDQDLPVLFLGTEKAIGLRINISNPLPSEDAHQAQLHMLHPSFLSVVDVENASKHISCFNSNKNDSLEICDIGNPFRSGHTVSMIIKFENDEQLYNLDKFSINLKLATSSVQDHLEYVSYPVMIRVETKLIIDGYSKTEQILFGGKVIGQSAVKQPLDAGLYVKHGYEVKNNGTSEVGPVILNISWPYAISNGKWLFYLVSVERDNNKICNIPSKLLDPLNLNDKSKILSDNTRRKREASLANIQSSSSEKLLTAKSPPSSQTTLSCPEFAQCVNIICNLGKMLPGEDVFVDVEGIVWNSTFLEEYFGVAYIKVVSYASVSVNLTNIHYADSSKLNDEVVTSLSSDVIISPSVEVQWWVIAAAVAAGVILLVVLTLILWRCGFFKRKRDSGDYYKAHKHRQASKKVDEVTNLVY